MTARLAVCAFCFMLACSLQPPCVVLSVKDPEGIAASASELSFIGPDGPNGSRPRESKAFPMSVTVVGSAGQTRKVLIEAEDANGRVIARARVELTFAAGRPGVATVDLAPACDTDSDCDDGVYCNGVRACLDGVCGLASDPCPPSPFACVQNRCLEDARTCGVTVDHSVCPPQDGESTYCDTTAGCVRGQPCYTDADCQDQSMCNGSERCLGFRCNAGIPPVVDDKNPCNTDACVEPTGAAHFPDASRDGATCVRDAGLDGICVAGSCGDSRCGDGYIDPRSEQCEDGNSNPNDGCDACRQTRWDATLICGLGTGGGRPSDLALTFDHVTSDLNGNLFVNRVPNLQIIRIDAGTGTAVRFVGTLTDGFSGDGGPAASADIQTPRGMATDGLGNLYFSTGDRVRRVDAQTGTIQTVAGNGTKGFGGDNSLATQAQLADPQGVALDGLGNLFIADMTNYRVRRVDATTGIITTIAGMGGPSGPTGNGVSALSASVQPGDLAISNKGDVYISDGITHTVRRVDATTKLLSTAVGAPTVSDPAGLRIDQAGGLVVADNGGRRVVRVDSLGNTTVLAGTGTFGTGGDGGPATLAQFTGPQSVVLLRNGDMLIGDAQRLRRVDANTGIITAQYTAKIFGQDNDGALATSANLLSVTSVAVDRVRGFFLLADYLGNSVRRVELSTGIIGTFAGNGLSGGPLGDGGPATDATVAVPQSVVLDASANVYVSQITARRIRRIDALTGVITTAAGDGSLGWTGDSGPPTSASVGIPTGLAIDGLSRLLFAQVYGHLVRRIRLDNTVERVAGNTTSGFSGDNGAATSAQLSYPNAIAVDAAGRIYIADRDNYRVRQVNGAGVINTLTGGGAGFSTFPRGATGALIDKPLGVATDAAGLLIASGGYVLRVDNAMPPQISVVAGNGTPGFSGDNGLATSAAVNASNVTTDDLGNIYLSDDRYVRVIDAQTKKITTVAGPVDPPNDGPATSCALGNPSAIASRAGQIFVADGSTGRVRVYDDSNGSLRTAVGYPNGSGADDVEARYSRKLLATSGIVIDGNNANNYAYVSERDGHVLRRVDLGSAPWRVRTYAGSLGQPGTQNGTRAVSRFNEPTGLAIDQTRRLLYVADRGGHIVRAVGLDTDSVTTIAGTPAFVGFFGEGVPATSALLQGPEAVAVGPDGSVYIADTGNNRVRRVDPVGNISTVLGDGTAASSGAGAPARLLPVDAPRGLAFDNFGNLFITSRVAVKVVTAGADGIVTGDDAVQTIYGASPRDTFPASVSYCLTGLMQGNALGDRMLVTDACNGFLIELSRVRQ